MHFKNEQDMKSNAHHHHHHNPTSATSTSTSTSTSSSSTSSADSGVIIIDNRTTIDSNNRKNTNNKSNHHSNGNINIKNTNNNNNNNNNIFTSSNKSEMPKDKRNEVPTKVDNSILNNHHHNHTHNGYNHAETNNININSNSNSNKKINHCDDVDVDDKSGKDDEDDVECNTGPTTTISIENVINIEKGEADAVKTSLKTLSNDNQKKSSYQPIPTNSSSKCCSPAVSIRSTSISIVSIDENAIDSSVVDSDSDHEADAEGVHANYVVKKLGQQTTYQPGSIDMPNINKGLTVLSQKISPNGTLSENILNGGFHPPSLPVKFSGGQGPGAGPLAPATPQIGSIALTNSTDVTFGDKHFYEGPVTIQQILIDRRDKYNADEESGHDNPGFAKESDCDVAGSKKNSSPHHPESPYSLICRWRVVIIAAIVVALMIAVGAIVSTMNSTQKTDDSDEEYDATLSVVGRSDWAARPPKEDLDKLSLPVRRVIISHTATESCTAKNVCIERMRVIQDFHMDSMHWSDIGYNFLIGGDGFVYKGRGWDSVGAHTKGYNVGSLGISFIGTFTTINPPKRQLTAAKQLIEEGVRLRKIAPDFCLFGARQLSGTESPGIALFNIIKTWPHWSDNIKCQGAVGEDNIGGGRVLKIIARDAWLAQPPSKPQIPLALPVGMVIVMPTQTDICTSQAMCTYRVRYIQTFNIESLQNDDIVYNFLIGGDGNVYEGRGWDSRGAFLKGRNSEAISLAFIGTFREQPPNDKQLSATELLLKEGVKFEKLKPDYKLYPATAFDPTSSATTTAKALYESFTKWPHWSEN